MVGCCPANAVQPEDQGKRQFDPDFKGPCKNRSCTDVLFLLLFIAFWAGMVRSMGVVVMMMMMGNRVRWRTTASRRAIHSALNSDMICE